MENEFKKVDELAKKLTKASKFNVDNLIENLKSEIDFVKNKLSGHYSPVVCALLIKYQTALLMTLSEGDFFRSNLRDVADYLDGRLSHEDFLKKYNL